MLCWCFSRSPLRVNLGFNPCLQHQHSGVFGISEDMKTDQQPLPKGTLLSSEPFCERLQNIRGRQSVHHNTVLIRSIVE